MEKKCNSGKIVILYHSGVGNSKLVAKKVKEKISIHYEVDIFSVEKIPPQFSLRDYNAMVIGFPTYHTKPSERILKFLENINKLEVPIPAFLFTTCGLYSGNTLRIFAKKCVSKNIIPITNSSYRCAATDGILLAPFMKFWFTHEKNLDNKIDKDCNTFLAKLKCNKNTISIPRFKWYSILNFPNKLMGQLTKFTIYVHKEKCIKCSKCINQCPVNALEKSGEGYPVFIKKKCENCYRCIHHCPSYALSLSKKKTPKRLIDF